MSNCAYHLVGNVQIPKERKDELNQYVLQILVRAGIRKTRKVVIAGKEILTVEKPEPDENGIVRFDYSIFEKKIRKESTYDMNICQLDTPDRGYNEYGVAMNLILTMLEAYSNGSCYLLEEDSLCMSTKGYAAILVDLLGITLDFPGRVGLWDIALFLRRNGCHTDYEHLKKYYFDGFHEISLVHFYCIKAAYGKLSEEPPENPIQKREQIQESYSGARWHYTIQIMQSILEKGQEEELVTFLRKLLEADRIEREEMAKEEGEYGILAEISLYEAPPILVSTYAKVKKEDFWKIWDKFHIEGYRDVFQNENRFHISEGYCIRFYKIIQRENEDEFLEFWDDKDVKISERMKQQISDWQEEYQKIKEWENFDVEAALAELIQDMTEEWAYRMPDYCFVKEFIECQDEAHVKALVLLRKQMNKGIEYFPELTGREVIKWILKDCEDEEDSVLNVAFCSLMTAHEHRKDLFGF